VIGQETRFCVFYKITEVAMGSRSQGRKKQARILYAGATFGASLAPVLEPKLAYTVSETVRLLSISRSTFYKLKKSKRLYAIKLFGRRLITHASIEKLLAASDDHDQ
jgi:excisionase family DNA binding protein